jgi:hypothetical protein
MSTYDQVTRMVLDNQAFALMGRLHVTLRRGTGRVTDIEFMRIDPGYCRHVLDLVASSDNAELRQIGLKLEEIYFGPNGLFVRPASAPLLARTVATQAPLAAQGRRAQADEIVAPDLGASREAGAAAERAYIGRLR